MKTYANYIGGEWVLSTSSRRVPNLNPANVDDVLGEIPIAGHEEATAAVEAAAAAFKTWRRVPAPKRGAIVSKAAQLLNERREEIERALTHEEGKLLSESRGELNRTINVVEYCGAHGRRLNGETIPLELPNNFGYTLRVPVGVVAVITPWNFPVAIPSWKIAPALVAGNTVVFKPSPLTPETSELVVRCFIDAGVPAGVLNLVHGESEVGEAFIDHPAVQAVSFTGSTPTGLAIYERAARRGIRVQAEMGGKNPVIILPDADLDLAVSGVLAGAFGSTGQRCTATSRVVVDESVADAFMDKLIQQTQRQRLGEGTRSDVDIGPIIDERQMQRVLRYIDIGKNERAELVYGGERLLEGDLAKGYFVQPAIFDQVLPQMRIAREEIFGPLLSVLRVNGFEEAIAVANDSPFGLTSSIYTRDPVNIFRYIDEIETGMTHVNSPTLGGEAQVPFGGTKITGVGPMEQGDEVFNFYTETKVAYIDYTGAHRQAKLY